MMDEEEEDDGICFCGKTCHQSLSCTCMGALPCYLYLMGAPWVPGDHLTKVGISTNPHKRLREVQREVTWKIGVLATWEFSSRHDAYTVEQEILRYCRAVQAKGEWLHIEWAVMKKFCEITFTVKSIYPNDFEYREHLALPCRDLV